MRFVVFLLLVLLSFGDVSIADGCRVSVGKKPIVKESIAKESACKKVSVGDESCDLDLILSRMNQAAASLETYRCDISYLFDQPLFESKTLRLGKMCYGPGDNLNQLLISFDSLQNDDDSPTFAKDVYFFDGVWLTHLDYSLKQASKHQMTEFDKPIDSFSLVSRQFPIIGFTSASQLSVDFDITCLASDIASCYKLCLKPISGSKYSDNYKRIDCYLDSDSYLPVKIIASSTEDELYIISLTKVVINQPISAKDFTISIGSDFGPVKIVPLEK